MSEFMHSAIAALVLLAAFATLVVLVRRDSFAGPQLVQRDRSGKRLRREVGRD